MKPLHILIGSPRPVYSADHTGRPTHTGERSMHTIEIDGVRVGYLFAPIPPALMERFSSPRMYTPLEVLSLGVDDLEMQQLDQESPQEPAHGETQSVVVADQAPDAAADPEAAPDAPSGVRPGDTGRAEVDAGDGLQPARGGSAASADGGPTVPRGPDARSDPQESAIATEREPGPPDAHVRVGAKVPVLCRTCDWAAVIPVTGDTVDDAVALVELRATTKHARESLGCDTAQIDIVEADVAACFETQEPVTR